jgi:hypothetical protein
MQLTRREVGLLVLSILFVVPFVELLQNDLPGLFVWALFLVASLVYVYMRSE